MTARILLVDDSEAGRHVLEAKLTSEYYEVATAADGPEALALAATHRQQGMDLGFIFYPLGDHIQLQIPRQPDHR